MDTLRLLLEDIAKDEGGRRFVINLHDSVEEGSLSSRMARQVLLYLKEHGPRTNDEWHRYKGTVADLVFGKPADFQFHGPQCHRLSAEWLTIRAAGALGVAIWNTSNLDRNVVKSELNIAEGGRLGTGLPETTYDELATMLNDPTLSIRFSLSPVVKIPADDRLWKAPCWLSCWNRLPAPVDLEDRPSTPLAGRLRDWLGLCHYGENEPLFMFRSRTAIGANALAARRPTTMDGFDNKVYKHRVSAAFAADTTGSTVDLARLSETSLGIEQVEGGHEVITARAEFSADAFECLYIGRAPALSADVDSDRLHELLLTPSRTIDGVIASLIDVIDASEA